MFCEKCKSLMLPKGEKIVCTRCGFERSAGKKDRYKVSSTEKEKNKLLIVDEEIKTLPTIRAECTKCGNKEAEWWLLQTRKADESEPRFFRCTECKFTWREYQ
jgi:DNA-directed RNA polymerase subunit M